MTDKRLIYCLNSPDCRVYNSFIEKLGDKKDEKEISGVVIRHNLNLTESVNNTYSCLALEVLSKYLLNEDAREYLEISCEKIDNLNKK